MKFVFFAVYAGFVSVSLASLTPPMEMEAATVLPPTIRSPRIKYVTSAVDSRLGADGSRMSLAAPFNRSVGWREVIDTQRSAADRASMESILNSTPGLSIDGSAGSLSAEVNTSTTAMVPCMAMGITDRLTVAVAVPIVRMDVSAKTGFARTAQGQAFIQKISESSSPARAAEVTTQLNTALDSVLAENGYEPLRSSTLSNIGDIRLAVRYALVQDSQQSLVIKPTIVFPTGTTANPDQLASTFTGDGRYASNVTLAYDRLVPQIRHLTWGTYAAYTALLPTEQTLRVPIAGPLTPDKERLTKNFANDWSVGSGLLYGIPGIATKVGAAYNFQWAAEQHFAGSRFSANRYAMMAYPEQTMHNLTLSANFSTTDWYRQKKFSVPFEATVSFTRPLAGRNVLVGDVVSGELVAYF